MLEIFPTYTLDNSIHTAILVGLFVSWVFTERLGWGFAGFVVPGYLAAIGVVQPISLVATLVEAILTYGAVWALGSGIPMLRLWAPVFGRERFLLFILTSVPIRLIVEGVLASTLQPVFWALFDSPGWNGQFFSIGIVLVPLLANAFWKSGLSVGLTEMFLKAGLSALLLALVLEPLTNFDLGNFRLTFDTLALDFLYMPRCYIILISTAALSTRLSLQLGWDFSGILIPSLLAVVVFTPMKLVWTAAEILVLVAGFHTTLRLPLIRSLDLSGPRQIVVMYLLSYTLKLIIAHLTAYLALEIDTLDIYGFGYLLTSLIALRCYQKSIVRVLVPVGLTTAGGFSIGSFIALALTLVAPLSDRNLPPVAPEASSLEADIVRAWPAIRKQAPDRATSQLHTSALLTFRELTFGASPSVAELRWRKDGLRLSWSRRADGTRCLGARAHRLDPAEPSGVPAMWWCGGDGPVLLVPQPRTQPDTVWIAAWLAHHGSFSGVVMLGSDDGMLLPTATRALRERMGSRPVIAISASTGPSFRLLPRSLGQDLLSAVREVVPELEVDFASSLQEPIWPALLSTDAVFVASIPKLAAQIDQATVSASPAQPTHDWPAILADREVSRTSHTYRSVSFEERYTQQDYLLRQVLRGATVATGAPPPHLSYLARLFDSELNTVWLPDGRVSWLLTEGTTPRGWGSWFVPLGIDSGPVLLAPASIDEPGTAGWGLGLLAARDGRALWVSSVGRDATLDERGRVMHGFGTLEPEPLGVLAALRESGPEPSLVIVRERAHLNAAREGLVLSDGHEVLLETQGARLDASLGTLQGGPFAVSSEDLLTRDTAIGLPRILEAVVEDRLTLMWLSRNLLSGADGHPDKPGRLAWYVRQGLTVRTGPLPEQTGPRVADAPHLTLLVDHLTTGLTAPLLRVPGRIEVFDEGYQVAIQASHDGVVCRARSIGPSGCWETE